MEILRIRFEHYRSNRYHYDEELRRYTRSGVNKSLWSPGSVGGKTICNIDIRLGEIEATVVGVADCSNKDIFCYATGREISKFRAMRFISAYKALENLVFNGPSETD